MKIHEGLEKKEVRDYLSTSLMQINNELRNLPKTHIVKKENEFWSDFRIRQLESEIIKNTEEITVLNHQSAILFIIQNLGWKELDVSDYINMDMEYATYPSFIGTKEEYEYFIQKCDE